MNKINILVCAGILLLCAIIVPQTANASADCTTADGVRMNANGGTIVLSQDSDVTVTFGCAISNYDDGFGISSPIYRLLGQGSSTAAGTTFNLGHFSAGQELKFFLNSPEGTFYNGPSSRNTSGIVHANVVNLGGNQWKVGWEDRISYDFDYNDVVFTVTATPTAATSLDCANGTTLSGQEVERALILRKLTVAWINQGNQTIARITNTTGCTAPLSIASYKIFTDAIELGSQQFFAASGVTNINANGTTDLTVATPSCRSQVDVWYQSAPHQLSDSAVYSNPNSLPYNVFGEITPVGGALCTTAPVAPANSSPKGAVFSCDGTAIYGWACDPDAYSSPVRVHAYADGDLAPDFANGVYANQISDSSVNAQCGGTTLHGFVLPFPDRLKDGSSHLFKVWALSLPEIGTGPNYNTLLRTLTCTPTATVAPASTCTTFAYSNWSTCSNGTQTRTVTNSYPSGCTGGSPVLSQSCSNPVIACSSNSECGTNGYIGSQTCSTGGNVYQDYKTWTCNNPGTTASSCTSNTTSQLKQTCGSGQTCSGGSCVSVSCSSNTDCGTNGYVNSPICSNGNVWQDYRTYTCNNPGTANSTCVPNTVSQLKTTCSGSQTCSAGSCTANASLSVSCYASPSTANINQSVNFYCNVSGGTGNYSYVWSGICSGTSANCTTAVTSAGTQTAYVVVTSGNQTQNGTASVAVNQNQTTCTTNYQQKCNGNNLYWYDSCGNQLGLIQYCTNGCANNYCTNVNNSCTYHSYQRCANNGVFWYDSCGNQQDLVQVCQNGCYGSTCQNNYNTTSSVQTLPATNVYNNQATFNGYLNTVNNNNNYNYGTCTTNVWFQWGASIGYGYETNHLQQGNVGAFTQNIANVYAGNTYHYRAVAQDCTGNIVYGQDQVFYPTQVLGASTISTGLTNNFWMDSFILPLILALIGIWMLRAGMFFGLEKWFDKRKQNHKNFKSEKELQQRILTIKRNEQN